MPEPSMMTRRSLVAAGALFLAPRAWAATPESGRLHFAAFRNGVRVGDHRISFTRSAGVLTAVTEVSLLIKVGPVPVFRYAHQAREQWRDGRFAELDTTTSSNGKRERVTARRTASGVILETHAGRLTAPANAAPLTHWNTAAFGGPLFHPQTGKSLKVQTTRHAGERLPTGSGAATRWAVRGEADIENWYDDAGVWAALKGRLPDKSVMEYRRV
jgi:hypothetical protein